MARTMLSYCVAAHFVLPLLWWLWLENSGAGENYVGYIPEQKPITVECD